MKNFIVILLLFTISNLSVTIAQTSIEEKKEKARQKIVKETNVQKLQELTQTFKSESENQKEIAKKWAMKNDTPVKQIGKNGKVSELMGFKNGRPFYYQTFNRIAAQTVSTDKVHPNGGLGLNLLGEGITIGIWDGAIVYTQHNAFKESSVGPYHAFDMDDSTDETGDHATHVAGTMIADGDFSDGRGMAEKATLHSYDWKYDLSEMTAAAIPAPGSNPLLLSNHSYGDQAGWDSSDTESIWYWRGEHESSFLYDDAFGYYDTLAWNIDILAENAPYYTIVWAAGNDRGEGPYTQPVYHKEFDVALDKYVLTNTERELDGGSDGFKCIAEQGIAKNIITVGAVDDIPGGYTDTSDVKQIATKFSSAGPTNDGRIKPDIVANGDNLYSPITGSVSNYGIMSGTSMAAPNVTGSLALLMQHYSDTHNQEIPKASTLKALIIHTADEAGSTPGPDYKFGWGLLNTASAAQKITEDASIPSSIQELALSNGVTYSKQIFSDGNTPIKVTIAWTDPAPANLSSSILVNDLDLRISNGTTFYPWKLSAGIPENAATQAGDNAADNVEQVYIETPTAGYYTVTVQHKSTLSSAQAFAMIISGDSTPQSDITIAQKDASGNAFGQAAFWNSSAWEYTDPTDTVTLSLEDHYFLAEQDYKTGTTQKYNQWSVDETYNYTKNFAQIPIEATTSELRAEFITANDATIKNVTEGVETFNVGTIKFADPWLVDAVDAQKGDYNRGISAPLKTVSSPFTPNTADTGVVGVYKGVFLNQNPQYLLTEPIYSLEATSPQPVTINGNSHNLYFQNWVLSNATLQNPSSNSSAVVFTSTNPLVKAYYKGTQLTDESTALTNTPQRKYIRAHSGEMSTVYESMGKIWLEWSTDGGTTWNLRNSGQPISEGTAKNPSIAQYGQSTYLITYQEKHSNGTGYNIVSVLFDGLIKDRKIVREQPSKLYTENANPVIACSRGFGDFIILWNEADYGGFLPGGLYYRGGKKVVGQSGYYELSFPQTSSTITGTNENSVKPTTASMLYPSQYPITHHVAWEQITSSSTSKINYTQFTVTSSSITHIALEEASSGSGYTKNYSPSLVVMDDNLPRLTWVGEKTVYQDDDEEQRKIGSTEGGGTIEKKVILRGRNASSWNSGFWKYGNDPNSVSMNYNESGTIGGYAFAWSEGSPTITGHKSVANTRINYSPVGICDAVGTDIHLCNGDGVNDMYTIGLDNSSLPYEIVRSEHIEALPHNCEAGQEKVSATIIQSVGREGLINYSESVFFFEVNDIMLDGEIIEFEPLSDTTNFNDLISLNSYLESLPFEVNNNSQLAYSVKYGVVSEEEQILEEGDFINYKVQLVDNVSNEVLGTYDNVTFNENNLELYDNINYIVETNGIGSRTVKMKLVVDYNVEADPNLATIFCESNLLEKSGAVTLNYNGAGQVTTYDLSQNYPNPFNPSTTIKYQIPNAGNVSLKIYDVLGAEVMTLVNTVQAQGRYEVSFDASQLSSGVYIYRIQANDYVASRKMMLLK